MHRKNLFLILVIVAAIAVGTLSFSIVAAQSALQPLQPTETPLAEEEETTVPEENLTVVAPGATREINPESLIFQDGWQFPINLSRSGTASEPQRIRDSNGISHVFWSDAVDSFAYTFGSGDDWSEPETSEFPFFTRRYFPDLDEDAPPPQFKPKLIADDSGQIVAFWIDNDGVLYYSVVPSDRFTDYDSWTPRAALTSEALVVDVAKGPEGRLHLVYIRSTDSAERPAGIYYRQLTSSGSWSDPVLLYTSRYLRSVPAGDANIQVLAPSSGSVYVVWDDTKKEQVFFSRSNNNGLEWDPPKEIDRRNPEDDESDIGAFNIGLGAFDGQLHLTWSAGHEQGRECTQYMSTSSDAGATWTYREPLELLPTCFVSKQFIVVDDTLFMLGTTETEGTERGGIVSSSYLLAWDGTQWSKPQSQEALSSFQNPETNQIVQLQCHELAGRESIMTLIGCDTAKGGDIWLLERESGEIDDWFPPPPIWAGPTRVNSDVSQTSETRLIMSSDGLVHAFWTEENSPRIFRASWDGASWGSSQEIITSRGGNAESISVGAAGDRLYLAWEDMENGLQFSTAAVSSPSQWTEPATVVGKQMAPSSPSLIADAGGNVFLAFAIQLNENRGIYLLHSADAGATWSAPIQVFDGSSAGWDMVDDPILTRTENGQMHLMWTRRTLPPDSTPLGFAYSRTEDLGQSWREAEIVVETQSAWNDLVGAGERSVHSLWAEGNDSRLIIWHRYSMDGGLNWSQAEQVIGLSNEDAISITVDPVQRLHLFILGTGQLGNLYWNDGQWIEDAGLKTSLDQGGALAASANQDGQLVVAYAGNLVGQEDSSLFAMWRSLDLPAELPEPLPTLTPTRPAPTSMPTSTPQPTPTVFFSTEQERSGLGQIPGMSGLPIGLDLIASLIPVLLIVGLGIIIGIRIIRKR